MNALLWVLVGLVLGGFSTAWVLSLVTVIRATRGGDK